MRHIRRRSKNTRSRLTAPSVSLFRKGDHVLKMLTYRKMQKCIPTPPARRPGGGSGGAWTVLREQDLQRSPPDRLFAYFLGEGESRASGRIWAPTTRTISDFAPSIRVNPPVSRSADTPLYTKGALGRMEVDGTRRKKTRRLGGSFIDYFFIAALTICRISSGVSMGQAISFLGQTAAHRPQEVHLL